MFSLKNKTSSELTTKRTKLNKVLNQTSTMRTQSISTFNNTEYYRLKQNKVSTTNRQRDFNKVTSTIKVMDIKSTLPYSIETTSSVNTFYNTFRKKLITTHEIVSSKNRIVETTTILPKNELLRSKEKNRETSLLNQSNQLSTQLIDIFKSHTDFNKTNNEVTNKPTSCITLLRSLALSTDLSSKRSTTIVKDKTESSSLPVDSTFIKSKTSTEPYKIDTTSSMYTFYNTFRKKSITTYKTVTSKNVLQTNDNQTYSSNATLKAIVETTTLLPKETTQLLNYVSTKSIDINKTTISGRNTKINNPKVKMKEPFSTRVSPMTSIIPTPTLLKKIDTVVTTTIDTSSSFLNKSEVSNTPSSISSIKNTTKSTMNKPFLTTITKIEIDKPKSYITLAKSTDLSTSMVTKEIVTEPPDKTELPRITFQVDSTFVRFKTSTVNTSERQHTTFNDITISSDRPSVLTTKYTSKIRNTF